MQDAYIYVVFFNNLNKFDFISQLIKFFTRSQINHSAVYLYDENKIVEPRGKFFDVSWKYSTFDSYAHQYAYIYRLKVTTEQKFLFEKFIKFLADTNTPYNYLGVIGFVIPVFTSNGGYFCSEGIYAALQFAGIASMHTKAWKYNPDMLKEYLENKGAELYKVLYIDKHGIIHELPT